MGLGALVLCRIISCVRTPFGDAVSATYELRIGLVTRRRNHLEKVASPESSDLRFSTNLRLNTSRDFVCTTVKLDPRIHRKTLLAPSFRALLLIPCWHLVTRDFITCMDWQGETWRSPHRLAATLTRRSCSPHGESGTNHSMR
jgi:hypothetical protein